MDDNSRGLYDFDLPEGVRVPDEYWRLVDDVQMEEFGQWLLQPTSLLKIRYRGLQERYPDEIYVPFATRGDQDDVACWTVPSPQVVVIHDFTEPGWERPRYFADLRTWMHAQVDEMLEEW